MAGWTRYNETTGEVETGLYERPYIVRATPPYEVPVEHSGDGNTTLTAFATLEAAQTWIERNRNNYETGPNGYSNIHVENWNE